MDIPHQLVSGSSCGWRTPLPHPRWPWGLWAGLNPVRKLRNYHYQTTQIQLSDDISHMILKLSSPSLTKAKTKVTHRKRTMKASVIPDSPSCSQREVTSLEFFDLLVCFKIYFFSIWMLAWWGGGRSSTWWVTLRMPANGQGCASWSQDPYLPWWWQGPKYGTIFCCLPKCISREMDCK